VITNAQAFRALDVALRCVQMLAGDVRALEALTSDETVTAILERHGLGPSQIDLFRMWDRVRQEAGQDTLTKTMLVLTMMRDVFQGRPADEPAVWP